MCSCVSMVYMTGSILNADFIVTAAHCVWTGSGKLADLSTIVVHAGDRDQTNPNEPGEQTRTLAQIFSYPGYPTDDLNNIAVLKLSAPLVLSTRAYIHMDVRMHGGACVYVHARLPAVVAQMHKLRGFAFHQLGG